jgi:hypothetical protein
MSQGGQKYRSKTKTGRECEPPRPEPLAYFLTWPTYGTWLPGDERGWVEYRRGMQLPDPILKHEAAARMTEDSWTLWESLYGQDHVTAGSPRQGR